MNGWSTFVLDGKPREIAGMSREELLRVIEYLSTEQMAVSSRSMEVFDAWRMCREGKRERI